MVESSAGGGTCRCTCQDEEYSSSSSEDEPSRPCCSPQVFTSILLGMLACVLMTGGVFLAFHRWDPLWLIVSGVGVILIFIGSILHCCSNRDSNTRRQSSGKGCCGGRAVQADHLHGHLVANSGSLTEQLLPLSNARSVSQLSLNMLPGYFPPVVTTYGIEQHSAVVQNINRLVQQQQQQQPQSPGSPSPGVANGAGKSFILLSLPGDATQANIQNLVATVYQLDGNVIAETPNLEPTPAVTNNQIHLSTPVASNAVFTSTQTPLVLKNVEVQTCNLWNNPVPQPAPSANDENSPNQCTRNTSNECSNPPMDSSRPSTSTASGATQTEDISNTAVINLMDLSPEIPSVCDNLQGISDSQPTIHPNIPVPTPPVLVDVSETSVPSSPVAIPEPLTDFLIDLPMTDSLVEVGRATESASSADPPITSTNVLIDMQENLVSVEIAQPPLALEAMTNDNTTIRDVIAPAEDVQNTTALDNLQSVDIIVDLPSGESGCLEPSTSCSNLSDIDGEVENNELPPSYDDVTLEGENAIGAFGLAYGTI